MIRMRKIIFMGQAGEYAVYFDTKNKKILKAKKMPCSIWRRLEIMGDQ